MVASAGEVDDNKMNVLRSIATHIVDENYNKIQLVKAQMQNGELTPEQAAMSVAQSIQKNLREDIDNSPAIGMFNALGAIKKASDPTIALGLAKGYGEMPNLPELVSGISKDGTLDPKREAGSIVNIAAIEAANFMSANKNAAQIGTAPDGTPIYGASTNASEATPQRSAPYSPPQNLPPMGAMFESAFDITKDNAITGHLYQRAAQLEADYAQLLATSKTKGAQQSELETAASLMDIKLEGWLRDNQNTLSKTPLTIEQAHQHAKHIATMIRERLELSNTYTALTDTSSHDGLSHLTGVDAGGNAIKGAQYDTSMLGLIEMHLLSHHGSAEAKAEYGKQLANYTPPTPPELKRNAPTPSTHPTDALFTTDDIKTAVDHAAGDMDAEKRAKLEKFTRDATLEAEEKHGGFMNNMFGAFSRVMSNASNPVAGFFSALMGLISYGIAQLTGSELMADNPFTKALQQEKQENILHATNEKIRNASPAELGHPNIDQTSPAEVGAYKEWAQDKANAITGATFVGTNKAGEAQYEHSIKAANHPGKRIRNGLYALSSGLDVDGSKKGDDPFLVFVGAENTKPVVAPTVTTEQKTPTTTYDTSKIPDIDAALKKIPNLPQGTYNPSNIPDIDQYLTPNQRQRLQPNTTRYVQ